VNDKNAALSWLHLQCSCTPHTVEFQAYPKLWRMQTCIAFPTAYTCTFYIPVLTNMLYIVLSILELLNTLFIKVVILYLEYILGYCTWNIGFFEVSVLRNLFYKIDFQKETFKSYLLTIKNVPLLHHVKAAWLFYKCMAQLL